LDNEKRTTQVFRRKFHHGTYKRWLARCIKPWACILGWLHVASKFGFGHLDNHSMIVGLKVLLGGTCFLLGTGVRIVHIRSDDWSLALKCMLYDCIHLRTYNFDHVTYEDRRPDYQRCTFEHLRHTHVPEAGNTQAYTTACCSPMVCQKKPALSNPRDLTF
jgi:hypothetical protein